MTSSPTELDALVDAFRVGELSAEDAAALLARHLEHPDLRHRGAAAAAFGELALAPGVPALVKALLRPENYTEEQRRRMPFKMTVAYQLLESLRVIGDPRATEGVRKFVTVARAGTPECSLALELLDAWATSKP